MLGTHWSSLLQSFLNKPECSVKHKPTIYYLLDYIGLNEILKSGN